eukprot:813429_1
MAVFLRKLNGKTDCLHFDDQSVSIGQLKERISECEGIPHLHQRLVSGTRELADDCENVVLSSRHPLFVTLLLRLVGGKGGFGSLLRAQKGKGKTTNFNAMRDLSGRRVRHVNAEKELRKWKEPKVNHQSREKEFVHIKETGRFLEHRMCYFGADCKFQWKCKFRHPGEDEYVDEEKEEQTKKRKLTHLSSSFGSEEDLTRAHDHEQKRSKMLSSVQRGLLALKKRQQKSQKVSETSSSSEEERPSKRPRTESNSSMSSTSSCRDTASSSSSSQTSSSNFIHSTKTTSAVSSPSISSKTTGINSLPAVSSSRSLSNSVHSGPSSAYSGPNSTHSGPNSTHSGPNSTNSGPNSTNSGPNSTHSGSNSIHSGSSPSDSQTERPTSSSSPENCNRSNSAASETEDTNTTPIDLSVHTRASDLHSLGMARLKAELMRRGLKCGGTLEQRAERLFLLKTTPIEKLHKKYFAKRKRS